MQKILPVAIIALILVGLFWFVRQQRPASTVVETSTPLPAEATVPSEAQIAVGEPNPTASVSEFTIVGSDFEFDTTEIRVNQGDTVRITFKNEKGMHDWVVDEFSARTSLLQAGKEETIEFVADKTGEFEYYCSVGQHRQMGMKGVLVVR